MLGMLENHALFLSLFLCIGSLLFCTFEVSPELNKLIHLHPFPDNDFRVKTVALVLMLIAGTFVWDRLVTALFAPKIFAAMLEQARLTTLTDTMPIFITLAKVVGGFIKVVGGFMVLGSGNPLIWFGAYWLYGKHKQRLEADAIAQLEARSKPTRPAPSPPPS